MENGTNAAVKTLIQVSFSSAINLRGREHAQACDVALWQGIKKVARIWSGKNRRWHLRHCVCAHTQRERESGQNTCNDIGSEKEVRRRLQLFLFIEQRKPKPHYCVGAWEHRIWQCELLTLLERTEHGMRIPIITRTKKNTTDHHHLSSLCWVVPHGINYNSFDKMIQHKLPLRAAETARHCRIYYPKRMGPCTCRSMQYSTTMTL